MDKILNVGVVGAGAISDVYLKNLKERFDHVKPLSVCALDPEQAKKKAEQYGIEATTLEKMLDDKRIDIILNLTPISAHYETIKAALEHGKHVYTEKVLCSTPEQAKELIELAKAKGLKFGSAPDTFLGQTAQKAKEELAKKTIGEITSFSLTLNRDINLLASLMHFLREDKGGVLYDFGVYSITWILYLLGPVEEVYATLDDPYPHKVNIIPPSPEFMKPYEYGNETRVMAVVKTKSGVLGTIHMNAESTMQNYASFRLYGQKGILELGDANDFDSPLTLLETSFPNGAIAEKQVPLFSPDKKENLRGLGVEDMALSILEGRPQQASASFAYEVFRTMAKMEESSKEHRPVSLL